MLLFGQDVAVEENAHLHKTLLISLLSEMLEELTGASPVQRSQRKLKVAEVGENVIPQGSSHWYIFLSQAINLLHLLIQATLTKPQLLLAFPAGERLGKQGFDGRGKEIREGNKEDIDHGASYIYIYAYVYVMHMMYILFICIFIKLRGKIDRVHKYTIFFCNCFLFFSCSFLL